MNELENSKVNLIDAATKFLKLIDKNVKPEAFEHLKIDNCEKGNIIVNFNFTVNLSNNTASAGQGNAVIMKSENK